MWSNWPSPCGVPAGEGPSRPNGVREVAVSQPAPALRPPTAAPPGSARCASQPHLPALLHAAGGQDTHWDTDPRHAAIRELHQLALRCGTVNPFSSRVRWTEIRFVGVRTHEEYTQVQSECYKYKLGFQTLKVKLFQSSSVTFGRGLTKAAFRETKICYCLYIYIYICLQHLSVWLWPPSDLSPPHSGQEKAGF